MSRFRLVTLVCLVCLVLSFAVLPVPRMAAQQPEALKVGYLPVVIYAPLFVGVDRGYFAAEGLNVELIPLPAGGGDSIIQLAAGNFDLAITGAGAPLWNAAKQGLAFKIVAPLHTERPPLSTPLVISAKRTEEIKTVADLKGKKVAVNNTGSAIEYWVYAAITKAGLSMDDITLVAMPFPQMPPALEAGAIDAAVITDPLATLAKDQGLVAFLADDFIDGITVTYVFAGTALLEQRPAAAEGFMRAYLKAMRDLQGEAWLDDSIATIIEKYSKVPAAVVKRMNRPYFDPNLTIPTADLEEVQRYFLSRKVLEYTDPLDVTAFIDATWAQKAVAALGPAPTPEATPGK